MQLFKNSLLCAFTMTTEQKHQQNDMEKLSDSIILKIIEFNLTHKDFTNFKIVNKAFYDLLNPNQFIINKIWEEIAR